MVPEQTKTGDDATLMRVSERFVGGTCSKFADKRQAERYDFNGQVRITPYTGGDIPPLNTFEMVKCRDLSTSGIAMYLRVCPTLGDKFIMMLGSPEKPAYIVLCVARVSEGWWERKRQYLAGCFFESRM